MPLIKEETALKKLQKHLAGFRSIVQGGWDDLLALFERFPELRTIWSATTKATVVHDFQIGRACLYAESVDGVRVQDSGGMKVMVVDSQFAIRMKKLDDRLLPSNQLTDQVKDFRGQQQLPGFPKTYNLDLGYVLNRAQTTLEQIFLVFPNGPSQNYWESDLLQADAAGQKRVIELFEHLKPQESEEEDDATTVRPKRDGTAPLKRESDDEKS